MNNPIITADRLGRRPSALQAPFARAAKNGGLIKIAPVTVLVLMLLMPPEVRVNYVGQTIYAYRLAWLLLTPWVMMRLMRGQLEWRFNDLLVFLGSSWMTVSFVVIYGLGEGITRGLALTLDIFMPFIIARLAITQLNDFRRLLITLAPVFFLIGATLAMEAIGDRRFVRDAAASVFGSLGAVEFGAANGPSIATDRRFGLLRAMGPFSHPILAGLFFSGLLPLYHFGRINGWPKITGLLSGACAILTFSSAAMIGIFLFLLLAIYDRLQRMVVFLNWPLFMVVVVAFLAVLQVTSESGLISILIKYTFNPISGYYRLLIWEFGSISVSQHPWFGIGFEKFKGLDWMGDSVDAYWLAIAIRNGLPSALLLALAQLFAFTTLAKAAAENAGNDKATLIGLASATIILFVLGFTVSFFGGLLPWFAIMLGVGTTLGRFSPQPAPPRLNQPRRPIA